jgi:WD repeat and SOF domain-containing protein 1
MVKDICFAPTFQSGTSAEGSSSRMAMDAEEDEAEAEARTPSRLLSCGVDKTVKLWDARGHSDKPLQTYTGKHGFK